MKYVVCPPCGTVFEGETEQDVIRTTQLHAKEKHDYVPPREEILSSISSTPPESGDVKPQA
jgi:predicted small metal-binding protein